MRLAVALCLALTAQEGLSPADSERFATVIRSASFVSDPVEALSREIERDRDVWFCPVDRCEGKLGETYGQRIEDADLELVQLTMKLESARLASAAGWSVQEFSNFT